VQRQVPQMLVALTAPVVGGVEERLQHVVGLDADGPQLRARGELCQQDQSCLWFSAGLRLTELP
jgi:hypothetical protein